MKNLCPFYVDVASPSGVTRYPGMGESGLTYSPVTGECRMLEDMPVYPLLGYADLSLSPEEFRARFALEPGDSVIVPAFPPGIRQTLDAGLRVFTAPATARRAVVGGTNGMECDILVEHTVAPEPLTFVTEFRPLPSCKDAIFRQVKGNFPIRVRGQRGCALRLDPLKQSGDGIVVNADGSISGVVPFGEGVLLPNIPAVIEYFASRYPSSIFVTSPVGPDGMVDLLQVR